MIDFSYTYLTSDDKKAVISDRVRKLEGEHFIHVLNIQSLKKEREQSKTSDQQKQITTLIGSEEEICKSIENLIVDAKGALEEL